jgi:hypothetical protein
MPELCAMLSGEASSVFPLTGSLPTRHFCRKVQRAQEIPSPLMGEGQGEGEKIGSGPLSLSLSRQGREEKLCCFSQIPQLSCS